MGKNRIRSSRHYFFNIPEEARVKEPWHSPSWSLPPCTLEHALAEFHEFGKEGKLTSGMLRRLEKKVFEDERRGEWLAVEGPGPDGRLFAVHLAGDYAEKILRMYEVEPPKDNYGGVRN